MPAINRPIGVFDSGVGGLTVFAEIKKKLPNESIIYLGDTARVPYGNKSPETVIRYSIENAEFLKERGVKVIVVACNTASALALPALNSNFDIPIIGVVAPGANAAIKRTKKKVIGVIGTQATIASGAYARSLKELDSRVKVVSSACPLFVPLVEEGWLDNDVAESATKHYLSEIKHEGIDVLILGCTHYPLLRPLIAKVVGPDIGLIDSGEATAFALSPIITPHTGEAKGAKYQIYVTDMPAKFETIARRFLGGDIPQVKHVTL